MTRHPESERPDSRFRLEAAPQVHELAGRLWDTVDSKIEEVEPLLAPHTKVIVTEGPDYYYLAERGKNDAHVELTYKHGGYPSHGYRLVERLDRQKSVFLSWDSGPPPTEETFARDVEDFAASKPVDAPRGGALQAVVWGLRHF